MAIGNFNVFKWSHRFSTHLYSSLVAFEAHIAYHNIPASHLAGSGFKNKGIIATYYIAIAYLHILATINTNAIIVGNTHAYYFHIFDPYRSGLKIVRGPRCCI